LDHWKRYFKLPRAKSFGVAIMFCFALDSRLSFTELQELIEHHFFERDARERLMDTLLIGLKADTHPAARAVSTEDINALLRRFNIRSYFEVSSLENRNVREAFENLTTVLMLKHRHSAEDAKQNERGNVSDQKPQGNVSQPASKGLDMCLVS
jgi:hypothetical protein